MHKIKELFTPFAKPSNQTLLIMGLIQLVVFLTWWFLSSSEIIPNPIEIIQSMGTLIREKDLLGELFTSAWLCIKAMAIATVIGMVLSYSVVIPFFRPVVVYVISQARFLTLVGFGFIIMLYTQTADAYKTYLLVFGILPYFVTGMASEVDSMEWQRYTYARTLRMNNWEALYHVVIRGMLHKALEIFRQNFAIAWMMITMVESANRENGGIGALLVDQNRFAGNFNGVFAIQFSILAMGIFIHVLIGFLSRKLFPYAYMRLKKK
ncbi:MAG: nitrate ABC transporter permease [Chitinophagales bacterium]|nr:nitrate ABC transporter permease [Chitinophagales bacterium]